MKLIVILFSVLIMGAYQTENYYIIKVKGDIVNQRTGKHLAQGDAMLATDELSFKDENSMALVVSDTRGRFKLQYPKKNKKNNFEFTAFVKSALVGSNKVQFSTRSIITNSPVNDLKNFLGDDEFTVIGNSLDVQLNKSRFTNQKVVAKYENKGQQVDKELVTEDYKLQLSRNTMGVKTYGEVKLYHVDFYKQVLDTEEKITRLDVNFIDKNALFDEFKTILEVYKKKDYSKPQMKKFLMEYFGDFYGKTHLYTLNKFVDKIITENMQ
jgi:hypothetical protein